MERDTHTHRVSGNGDKHEMHTHTHTHTHTFIAYPEKEIHTKWGHTHTPSGNDTLTLLFSS